jgi:hypothetical protein
MRETNIATLTSTIKVLIEKGDHAAEKAEQFYVAAGRHLATLRAGRTKTEWEKIVHERCSLRKTRAYELMKLADGTRTVEQTRALRDQRDKKARKNKRRPPHGGRTNGGAPLEADVETIEDHTEEVVDRLDKENPDSPFLALTIRASDAWQLAQQAAACLPGVVNQTKPCPADWTTMIELVRRAADEWTKLATDVEAITAPATRRTKPILAKEDSHDQAQIK